NVEMVNRIAADPDFDLLSQSPGMEQGAPVVLHELPDDALRGKPVTITDNKRHKYQSQYAVIPTDQLLASHAADGSANPDYEHGLQGAVRAVGGNGRSAGIIEAYKRGSASDYRDKLIAHASDYGLDGARVKQVNNP